MTHASLFSGIGGFDLAAEWAGWTNLFNCEIDPFCRKVLNYHFPKAQQYEDVRTTDFTVWRGRIDVLTGGFPCQPFSVAGKRLGTSDERHLWPEMLRTIREIRPRWVVGENVLGIVNWSDGLVFEQVFADLEAEGYEVGAYVLPACGVGAPHRRYRTWFVAHLADGTDARDEGVREWAKPTDRSEVVADADSDRCGDGARQQEPITECGRASDVGAAGQTWNVDHARRFGRDAGGVHDGCLTQSSEEKRGVVELCRADSAFDRWGSFPTQSPVCGGDDGLPDRLDGITFPAWRTSSIKAYGNAIVPQVFLQIAKTINQYEL